MSLGYNFYSEGQGTNYFININQWSLIESRNIRMDGILQLGLNSNSSELDYKSGFGQKVTFNNLIFLKIMAGDLGTEPKEQDIKFIPSYGLSYIPGDSPFEINLSKSQEYGYNLGFNYYFGAKPKKGIEIGESDGKTGSPEIDEFVVAVESLENNIILLKEKLEKVSKGLNDSNEILSAIDKDSDGALGWASKEMTKGSSKAMNNAKNIASVKNPDDLNPAQHLREKLSTLKSGVVDGAKELKSIPDDLKGISEDVKALISSAKNLPKAARKLGFFKALKAIKVMKSSLKTLKNIPNEVIAIGDETKKVLEEIDQVLKNIQSILSTT